ncbi:MAG TPA: hypothetical protein DDZ68_15555 [Parvularcula sp.]|nr:hypothetical protein [Parvularcula sp.]HBS32223.1 hypothetical protein [Parvularcula sp.]
MWVSVSLVETRPKEEALVGRFARAAVRSAVAVDGPRFDWIRAPVKDYRHHIIEIQRAPAAISCTMRFLRTISGRDIAADRL